MSYTLLYNNNGLTRDISSFASKIQFGGEMGAIVRKMEVSLFSGTDIFTPKLEISNGGILTLLTDEKELMRAVIFKRDRSHKGEVSITAYTHGVYLAKNKNTAIYNNMKASQIAQDICGKFGIPAGNIEDTEVVLPSLVLRDKTLWDMLAIALDKTTKDSGKRYRVFFKEGKLNIGRKNKEYVPFVLEKGANLISAGSSVSIEELKNKIKITGRIPEGATKPGIVCEVDNTQMQKLYGILQESREESGEKLTQSDLKRIADNLLKELCKEQVQASVEATGIDGAEAGMAVYVVEPVTGITGSYYIKKDDHTIEGNKHTMRLQLSLTDDTAPLEYSEGG